MTPLAEPGTLTERERFLFATTGYLVIPNALSPDEVAACLDASQRAHAEHGTSAWRQIGHLHEAEPAIEELIDHPSVLPKVRALLGDYFIVQSTWCTLQPRHTAASGYHQDGSSAYEFRRLAIPTPLVQLRVGYYLTDQSQPDMGNMVMIPGTHNVSVELPRDVRPGEADVPIHEVICGAPGTALLFHQGVYHRPGANSRDFDRYTMHIVYSPPWLMPSDRSHNDPAFLARTTPLRRSLMGEWKRPEEPFGVGYERPPFDNLDS
ncbi:MAG: phytanoyl-CoA dioxygenase family protein [Roseiflexaceae bacterium]|nr:phytanoyl-CoA dioxygenase family protein [Roseiflexaceae bacterium]